MNCVCDHMGMSPTPAQWNKVCTLMEGQPIHAPLSVPVIEIGFSNDPYTRLKQHRHHESSNYLMNFAEAAFETEFPGAFR